VVELTQAQFDFVLENIETNMAYGLRALQQLQTREAQERMVQLLEKFKDLKAAFDKAI